MLGALIGAGSSIIGGLLNRSENRRQEKLQKEFAQSGIQWKVEDAKKAGIHPLYALGAQTTSYAPQTVGDIGGHMANAGQDISRAIDATRTSSQRVDAYAKTVQDLTLQRMGLENEILSSQLAKTRQAGNPPAMAGTDDFLIDGQGNSAIGPNTSAMARQSHAIGSPHQEAGAVSGTGFERTSTGYAITPSKDVKDRIEDDLLSEIPWHIRNRVPQSFQMNLTPPYKAPQGTKWYFHPYLQEYRLYDSKGRNVTGWKGH